jgi:hypothetical protein
VLFHRRSLDLQSIMCPAAEPQSLTRVSEARDMG